MSAAVSASKPIMPPRRQSIMGNTISDGPLAQALDRVMPKGGKARPTGSSSVSGMYGIAHPPPPLSAFNKRSHVAALRLVTPRKPIVAANTLQVRRQPTRVGRSERRDERHFQKRTSTAKGDGRFRSQREARYLALISLSTLLILACSIQI